MGITKLSPSLHNWHYVSVGSVRLLEDESHGLSSIPFYPYGTDYPDQNLVSGHVWRLRTNNNLKVGSFRSSCQRLSNVKCWRFQRFTIPSLIQIGLWTVPHLKEQKIWSVSSHKGFYQTCFI